MYEVTLAAAGSSVFCFLPLFIIPPLLYTRLSPHPEVFLSASTARII
jgi:hypothetical protein